MNSNPFTLQQATIVCAEFKKFIGHPIKSGLSAQIQHVLISPYDELNMNTFVTNFMNSNSQSDALETYPGPSYDVILFGYIQNTPTYVRIRKYASEMGIHYRFPSSFIIL